ncbi:centromere protein F [Syngnathus typhle]|uniref:centromere protein F n=1 Tax=Syngnathus typhle TaxID=161592 RepID=UPI002A6A3490|nr:centromere protein F [Syngnathus typhle]
MSWAEEDWTAGLSGRVLQRVKELQAHQERLSRENKQKQLQLDNIHLSHDKQTVKYEEMRGELHAVRRELQSAREEAQVALNGEQRLTQELQTKQAQICFLEGQLDAARTVNNKLTQQIKRLEAELEKLQNGSRSTDSTPFSTPCWSASSPWEHHGSRKDERMVQNEEMQSSPYVCRLQFPDTPSTSLPRLHKATPRSHPSDPFSTPLAAFPWERDDPKPAARRASPSSPQTPVGDHQSKREVPEREKDLSTQADMSLSQMRHHAASLEQELSEKTETLKSLQDEVALGKKNMAATKLSLQRAHNELSGAHTRIAQETERASAVEQRLKQLQEELKCQRQNADSSRLQHQQRTKELDKQHQRDLLELQKEKQCMEKQHQQEVNKLNQELQQARTLHNALQAQADKLSQQKQTLEKELESLKDKVKFTEAQLQESQKKETQIQAKLKEVMLDAECVTVSLEQSKKRERALEEEAGRLAEEKVDALRLLKELQEQKASPLPDCTPLVLACAIGQSSSSQPSSRHTRSSAYTKRPATLRAEPSGVKQEEEVQQRAEISVSYPPDREPGEGIDSEHIIADTECSCRGVNYEEKESSSSSNAPAEAEKDTIVRETLKSEQTVCTDDLQRENASLRSELGDMREALQKQLDDLEVQRCAEVETRTRLKQLSRKHASQGAEREEQDKQWKAQLEREKSENDRLRKTLAALEEREERDGTTQAREDREAEMMQLNLQLKQQLGEVKVQLALEREGRERDNKELTQIAAAEREANKQLIVRQDELTAQLAELKSGKDEESLCDAKVVASSPLTYMTLLGDRLDSNNSVSDNQVPSPEQYAHFCQSTNRLNTPPSQNTTMAPQHSQLSHEGQTGQIELEDTSSDHLRKDESESSDLAEEIERLRQENARETERAKQLQFKLTALQNQLTSQTKQLTLGFEKQSQYISGLLTELQEKDGALLSQGEELRRCIQELDALKDEGMGRKVGKISTVENCILTHTSNLVAKKDVLPTALSVSHDITSEKGQSHDEIINHLQTQVVALQKELEELTEVARQQTEELSIWKLASQPSSTLDHVLPSRYGTPTQRSAKDHSAALVIREDEVLLSCVSNRLQGRMLCNSVHQNNMQVMSILQAPADMNTPSDKDTQPSGPNRSPHKFSDQETGQDHVSKVPAQTSDGSWTASKHLSASTNWSATSVSTQTEHLRSGATEALPERHCVHTQTVTEKKGSDDVSPHQPQAAPSAGRETGDKMLFSTSFPIPADPVRLAERIRRNRMQLSAAFDDTEYEPYGLPEVVMKGFADIPTGASCPYIVRRGLLGTAVVPVNQKEAIPEDETD